MKRFLILPFMCVFLNVYAPNDAKIWIEHQSGLNPHENAFNAVCRIESNFNPLAYNEAENARGIAQIRPIKIDDYNNKTGQNIQYEDVYCMDISKKIFLWHMEQYGVYCINEGIRRWNGDYEASYRYLEKVLSIMDKNNR